MFFNCMIIKSLIFIYKTLIFKMASPIGIEPTAYRLGGVYPSPKGTPLYYLVIPYIIRFSFNFILFFLNLFLYEVP